MKILIVEDSKQHMTEAIAVIEAAGHEVVRVYDKDTFDCYVPMPGCGLPSYGDTPRVDAVISDIFFPYSNHTSGQQTYASPDCPVGVAVALRCESRGVPFVFCTDGYHHGNKLQWIFALCNERDWEMVDATPELEACERDDDIYVKPASHKKWAEALVALERRMSK